MATKQKVRKKKVEITNMEEQEEQPQVEEIEEIPEVAEMEFGEDPSALFTSVEEKSLEIIHAGKKWVFRYKELTWGEKNLCIDDSQTWDASGNFSFSISKYYAAALTRMLTHTPIRPITETTLNRLDRRIGEQLVAIVPQPVEQVIPDLKG
jgi:hypothetical protein